MEFIHKQATINATSLAHGNNGKAVLMKTKQSRKKTTKNATNTSSGPNQTLDTSTFGKTLVVESVNKKTVLNDIGKRKKKRRKKQPKNKTKDVVHKTKQTVSDSSTTISETELQAPVNKDTTIIDSHTNTGFDGPSNSNNSSDFGNFNNTQIEIPDKSILHNNRGSSQGKPQPEVHDVEDVHTKVIDKELVNWEHFALIIEEYYLTVNT